MKRMKYGGIYNLVHSDLLVYQDNGKSVITLRELREREMPVFEVPWVQLKTQWHWNKNELLEEQKMNNYFVLDGKQIPMSDETAKSLREKQKTYSIGDCFRVGEFGTIVRLVQCSTCNVVAVCIGDYNRWSEQRRVGDYWAITHEEVKIILDRAEFTLVTIKKEEVF